MQSFDEELDQWLDAIMAAPKFASMTAEAQEQVEIIVTISNRLSKATKGVDYCAT